MTAPMGTLANLYTGQREQSQVTNSYGGYFISGGVAYNLHLPFLPDKFEWYDYTGFATNTTNVSGVWFRDFPAAAALITTRGTTTLTTTLETTNGITNASTPGGFYDEHLVISGITTASPAVVTTTTNHNLSNMDRVVITKVIGTMAQQINNFIYVVQVLSPTTFALYDVYGVPITVLGAYTSSGQVTKNGPLLGNPAQSLLPQSPQNAIADFPPQYILTLGTAVMGADSDVIYFNAFQFNNYVNLGDVG